MFFNFEIAYKCSVYGNNSKSYIKFNRNNNYLLCLIASCIGLLLFSISLLGIYIVRMMFVITQTPQYMISEITEENID